MERRLQNPLPGFDEIMSDEGNIVQISVVDMQIVEFMRVYLDEHSFVPPSVREICSSVKAPRTGDDMSTSEMNRRLRNLVEKEILHKAVEGPVSRSITLNEDFDWDILRIREPQTSGQ
jgi:hypothetical protein